MSSFRTDQQTRMLLFSHSERSFPLLFSQTTTKGVVPTSKIVEHSRYLLAYRKERCEGTLEQRSLLYTLL